MVINGFGKNMLSKPWDSKSTRVLYYTAVVLGVLATAMGVAVGVKLDAGALHYVVVTAGCVSVFWMLSSIKKQLQRY